MIAPELATLAESIYREALPAGWRFQSSRSGLLVLWHEGRGLVWFRVLTAGEPTPVQRDQLDSLRGAGADVAYWDRAEWPTILAGLVGREPSAHEVRRSEPTEPATGRDRADQLRDHAADSAVSAMSDRLWLDRTLRER